MENREGKYTENGRNCKQFFNIYVLYNYYQSTFQKEAFMTGDQNQSVGSSITLLIFGSASLLLIFGTQVVIPFINKITGLEIIICWFLVAGLFVFFPLLLTAYFILKKEGWWGKSGLWKKRLRFRPMNKGDWFWGLGSIVVIGLLSLGLMKSIETIFGEFASQPPFMVFEPLGPDRIWILILWLPYWLLNILGEEILWRGTILPIQEEAYGKFAWFIHGTGWAIFHLAFGWQLLVTLLPILYIQSWVVSRRENSWIGVLIHGGINGPSFIAIALGLL